MPGPNQQFSLIRDEEIVEEKLNSLAKLVNNMKEKQSEEDKLTAEEVVQQFSYIMTEKVKKD